METVPNSSLLGSICEGCLCTDRRLTAIVDENKLKIFCGFLGDLDLISHPLLLCWECTAVVKKVSTFIEQVRTAHNRLVKYMLRQATNLSPLSKLNIQTLEGGELDAQSAPELGTLPITFIKLEEHSDGADELFYPDEGACDEDFNSENVKADITTDPIKYEPLVCEEIPKTRKTKKKVKEHLNNTSDELLKVKSDVEETTEVTERKPKRRKKIKDDNKSKVKQTRRRREKPAGVVSNHKVDKILQRLNLTGEQLQMVILSWEEVEEERRRALEGDAFKRLSYRCYDCALGFNHSFKLDNHMRKHAPESGAHACRVCNVRCRSAHALCAHQRRHRVKWRCAACGHAWSRASVAADHVARAHGAAAPPAHLCAVCGHSAPTLNKLRSHVKRHAERQRCELCDKTFVDRTSLRNHLFIHNGSKEFSCPRCGKLFLFKRAMELHQLTHEASALLYCHECDLNFKNQISYRQHMLYSLKHIDPAKLKYACKLCDKKFLKAKRLEEHNLAVHLKATPIRCTVPGCSFACASRPVLRTHARMLHRDMRARRDHVCDVCGKAYASKSALGGHLRAHSGERPLRCARCPAAFGYEAALYNHTRLVHLGRKSVRRVTKDNEEATPTPAADPAGPLLGPAWPNPAPVPQTEMPQQSTEPTAQALLK